MKIFRAELHRALTSPGFFAAVGGTALVCVVLLFQGLLDARGMYWRLSAGYHSQIMLTALSSQAMALAIPVLCALPFTASFLEDVSTGYVKFMLCRCSRRQYLWSRYVTCILTGALSVLLGLLIGWGLCALVFTPMEEIGKDLSAKTFLLSLPAIFGSCMVWSAVGLVLGTATGSKFMAYASPFVLCYLLIILYERYFTGLFIIYPKELLQPSAKWPLGVWGAALWMMELTGLMGLLFHAIGERRLGR